MQSTEYLSDYYGDCSTRVFLSFTDNVTIMACSKHKFKYSSVTVSQWPYY